MSRRAFTADHELQRLAHVKHVARQPIPALGPELIGFFKHSVAKRHDKLAKIAAFWESLVPAALNDHCALESLSRGSLTVIVDSASHLWELKQLLLAGIQQQLLITCRSSGLRKIVLKPGRWYEGGDGDDRKPRFAR